MEEYYLNIDLLGKLYINEIFVYYDEPLMFSCVNKFRQLFLANCVDEEDEIKKWLLVPISYPRLLEAKQLKITAYELFVEPEDEFIWEVNEYIETNKAYAKQVVPSSIEEKYLPLKNTHLLRKTATDNVNFDRDTVTIAIEEQRDVVDISLELDNMHEHEIGSDVLGNTLCEFQKLVYSIAHKAKGFNTSIPKTIIEDNQLKVTEFYAASFGVRLKSNDIANLYGETKVQKSLRVLFELLEAKSDREKIQQILETLSPTVGYRYRALLKGLVKDNIGIKTYISTPSHYNKTVFLNTSEINKSLQVLESEISCESNIVEYYGELVGIDVDSNTFVFKPLEGKKISGKLSETVQDKYIVPINIRVTLKEEIEINTLTNKEEVRYTLINIMD